MAKAPAFRRLTLSVLDRLMDEATRTQILREQGGSMGSGQGELFAAVGRDLEFLLNTRRPPVPVPEGLVEVKKSPSNYGIPDLSGVNFSSPQAREDFRRAVEETIRTFEPRFKSVRVRLKEGDDPTDRTLHLRIEGMLHAEPAPEPVVFDSVLEPVAGEIDVKAGGQ